MRATRNSRGRYSVRTAYVCQKKTKLYLTAIQVFWKYFKDTIIYGGFGGYY